jgi:hypothetical protein
MKGGIGGGPPSRGRGIIAAVPNLHSKPKRFRGTIGGSARGRVYLRVPFDPGEVWGPRDRHHVAGTIAGHPFRGALEPSGQGWLMPLGPSWRREVGLAVGDQVPVTLAAEGPQREALAPDIAAALDAAPAAAAFFDSLATFYRKGYLRWIDATKRRPDVRAARIGEMIQLLADGRKTR